VVGEEFSETRAEKERETREKSSRNLRDPKGCSLVESRVLMLELQFPADLDSELEGFPSTCSTRPKSQLASPSRERARDETKHSPR